MERTLRDILRSCSVGRMQSVGVMQVLPLISTLEDERFASPEEAEFSTTEYGKMRFENTSGKTLLVPCHAGYVTKHSAQDHAMAHAGMVARSKTKTFKTAMCIQQSQGGYIPKGSHKMLILPYSLREEALKQKDKSDYAKLWPAIREFNKSLGLKDRGHLEDFLKHFKKELDEFVSEFEIIPDQIGAIVLINGQVVGIEKAPSRRYWRSVWESLIRECYGAYAIEVVKKDPKIDLTKSRIPLPTGIANLEQLKDALAEVRKQDEDQSKSTVRALLDIALKVKVEEKLDDFAVETLTNKNFTGQIVRDSEVICYASLVCTKHWRKNGKWLMAKEFAL